MFELDEAARAREIKIVEYILKRRDGYSLLLETEAKLSEAVK